MSILRYSKVRMEWMVKVAVIIVTCHLSLTSSAQSDTTRVFTEEHPLVYEDAWDLWPYVYLNEKGEPVGYNIDLLKLIFKELNIPYVIKLKPTVDALNDLKAGNADLMCGMDAHFHNDYAQYGKSVIQLFTHSVVHQKSVNPTVRGVEDLANHRVIVHAGSFSHHLMIQRGWSDNAIPYDDMQDAVQKAHLDPNSQIVWNTLSLKWLINKFHFDDLELTPVDVQHGEYKFMSNNPRLLQQLDSVYTMLRSADRLQPIQNKWFYPERQDTGIPSWVWKLAALLIFLILGSLVYYIVYRIREKKMTKAVRQSNNRLALILKSSKVRIWIYHVAAKTITPLDEQGYPMETFSSVEYFKLTTPEDFERLRMAIESIVSQEQNSVTLNVMAKDNASNEMLRNFTFDLSVFRRDKNGSPIDLIGTRSDVTEEKLKQQQVKDMMLNYQAIFNSAMVDMVAFDENGVVTEINEKCMRFFSADKKTILAKNISVNDMLGMDVDINTMEPLYLTQIFKDQDDPRLLRQYRKDEKLYYELKLVPVRDENGHLLSIYGTGRNVTEFALSYSSLKKNLMLLQDANNEMRKYIRNIDYVLKNGNVRMVNYSPVNHTLAVFSELDHVQYRLTQTRAIQLTDEEYKTKALRLFNNMDNLTAASINTTIKTSLRVHGRQLFLHFSFIPAFDAEGNVNGYFGMCRDVSEIKVTEAELERETVKAQEVEAVKNAFLRNMSYEIRTPLNAVVGFAELFEMEHSNDDEVVFINEIKQNSSLLLKLINDILFLSRLDACMIEFKSKPVDFASFFGTRCQTRWFGQEKPNVIYSVDSPYDRLVVEVDEQNLGIVIDQILSNAIQHTDSGSIRARYDFNGELLVMTFQDTGCGIPESMLDHIFDRFMSSDGNGLGLSICHEIIGQMGGKIKIKSTVGEGTIVWVTIPCKVIELERK